MSETATSPPPAVGTFCWDELMTTDVGAAKTFYTELLGWSTEEMDMGEMGTYTMFKKGEQPVAGMMAMPPDCGEGVPPCWMSYIAVDDVDASTARVEQLGGKVCVPPTDIPNVGRFSVITDPTGAMISLFKGKSM